MKNELLSLLKKYRAYCEAESKKIDKDPDTVEHKVLMSFEGFIEWLEEEK